MINRVILFVIDSFGIGALPDAKKFGDVGANTLGNIAMSQGGINLQNLRDIGLGNIDNIVGVRPVESPMGVFGRAIEFSNGKDSITGHWELAGLHLTKPFKTFPRGFPESIISELENKIGRKVLGNKPASGTVILDELGEKHMKTGYPIVYTSADSVLQIAAHEDIISLDELYSMCKIAREIVMGDNAIARIIARPFIGTLGNFVRTPNRRDYSLDPFGQTVLDIAKREGLDVIAIGKIRDIFNGRGITHSVHTKDNMDGIDKTIEHIQKDNKGIIFTNLVEFDSHYGHRRDPEGYKRALEEMDKRIPEIGRAHV